MGSVPLSNRASTRVTKLPRREACSAAGSPLSAKKSTATATATTMEGHSPSRQAAPLLLLTRVMEQQVEGGTVSGMRLPGI